MFNFTHNTKGRCKDLKNRNDRAANETTQTKERVDAFELLRALKEINATSQKK